MFGNSDVTIIIIIYTLFITCILLSSDEIILMVFGLIIMYLMDCLILRGSSLLDELSKSHDHLELENR